MTWLLLTHDLASWPVIPQRAQSTCGELDFEGYGLLGTFTLKATRSGGRWPRKFEMNGVTGREFWGADGWDSREAGGWRSKRGGTWRGGSR